MYRDAFTLAGFRVVAVQDGYEALLEIEAAPPDAIVLDLMLPRVAGLDVYRDLRANPRTSEIPIVIVSAADGRDPEDESRVFLPKPIDIDALVTVVSDALSPIGHRRESAASTLEAMLASRRHRSSFSES
jgi:DNA-binding response OmpR family regulator